MICYIQPVAMPVSVVSMTLKINEVIFLAISIHDSNLEWFVILKKEF